MIVEIDGNLVAFEHILASAFVKPSEVQSLTLIDCLCHIA